MIAKFSDKKKTHIILLAHRTIHIRNSLFIKLTGHAFFSLHVVKLKKKFMQINGYKTKLKHQDRNLKKRESEF